MKKTIGLLAAVLVITVMEAASATGVHPAMSSAATNVKVSRFVKSPTNRTLTVLYDQNNSFANLDILSQNFETQYVLSDAQAADDFTVPAKHKWHVQEIDVTGIYYNGMGLARDENIFFYKDAGGLPGALVKKMMNVKAADNGKGSFVITLPKKGVKLKPGRYWVSVVANMDFKIGGQWGWEANTFVTGNQAAWQNPGGGWGSGCTTWGNLALCYGIGSNNDLAFALKGIDQ
jgi:hypothetical protein